MERRHFLQGIAATAGASIVASPAWADAAGDFAALLAKAQNDPALTAGGGGPFERINTTRTATPHTAPSKRTLPKEAIDTIVLFEVTSAATYKIKYQRPTWPQGKSGVTVGVGYDIGYSDKPQFEDDWKGLVPDAAIKRLEIACLVHGGNAKADAKTLGLKQQLQDVAIDWDTAYKQFTQRTLPHFTALTEGKLSNTDKLSSLSLGALVSLVYNRGASFGLPGTRYAEMRLIAEAMQDMQFKRIPQYISDMKHIWQGQKGVAGLLTRRDLEAKLFAAGL